MTLCVTSDVVGSIRDSPRRRRRWVMCVYVFFLASTRTFSMANIQSVFSAAGARSVIKLIKSTAILGCISVCDVCKHHGLFHLFGFWVPGKNTVSGEFTCNLLCYR